MAINLYGYWRSSCTWRVRLVLAYKGLAYTPHPVHLLRMAASSISPVTLRRTQWVRCRRSTQWICSEPKLAGMLYLEEKFTSPSVLPKAAKARFEVLEIAEAINSGTQPLRSRSDAATEQ